ncbi:hypothetical protein LWC34_51250 [Kibdelosporangium philippinense]|uniref:Nucleotidyltransferase domain-containing protein n=1 Tax=Kibdelosporangium philippinense TaxID=211113 RepID=A0ABS8ZTS0_9PSEU|nr:hypothetical protein [Kibdelosporangium philippinense]MCE7011130.1 hypothetical protein [Kibdelosporangium philippinense]
MTKAACAVVNESVRAYQNAFGERLIAAYLLGSLAYGGYSPVVSDIDLAVVLNDIREGDRETVATTNESLHAQSDLHRKLSVFWGSLTALREGRDDGRFPALDRLEVADHGKLLFGEDIANQVARPTSEELLLESAKFAVDILASDAVIAEFHRPRRLLDDAVWFSKAVLFPVRFLYSTRTSGRAATNDEAIDWYLDEPRPVAASLVRLAARVRAGHPLDPAELTPELATGLIPLYLHYIDVQLPRFQGKTADLVTAFTEWRERLA